MSDQKNMSFEDILTEFFTTYRKQHLKRVASLSTKFEGQEKEIMYLLCKKYNVKPEKIAHLIDLSEYTEVDAARNEAAAKVHEEMNGEETEAHEHTEGEEEHTEEEAPSGMSKKKLFIIILILALAGAGAGYFAVGMLEGGSSSETEAVESSEEVGEMEAPEALPEDDSVTEEAQEEVATENTDSTAATDSTTEVDSSTEATE